jgi:hypothetical protein
MVHHDDSGGSQCSAAEWAGWKSRPRGPRVAFPATHETLGPAPGKDAHPAFPATGSGEPGAHCPLSPSAGYGKSTLVTEWPRGLQTITAWLSLDEADNDPARFLADLIATLQVESKLPRVKDAVESLPPRPVDCLALQAVQTCPTLVGMTIRPFHVSDHRGL